METQQLSIFNVLNTVMKQPTISSHTVQSVNSIEDIRSTEQTNREVAFDVGEKIGGARKDLAQQRQSFLTKPSIQLLSELEDMDKTTAAEVIIRQTFFDWFTFEDCREREVEPGVAKAIQLFIHRIPKESNDSVEDRRKYTNTLLLISDSLRNVKTKNEFFIFEKRLLEILYAYQERGKIRITEGRLREMGNSHEVKKQEHYQFILAQLFLADMSHDYFRLKDYPGPLRNYFMKHASRVGSLRKAFSIKTWDELLPPLKENTATRKVANRKSAWERDLPEQPSRLGGEKVIINEPKQYIKHFGFRGCEFGNYMDDKSGGEHLAHSAGAFTDLAEILNIPLQAVSLKGELAMAFGARGRGRALGHYEPARKVINLTKEKGSLGILAHEWFHSLDHFLFSESYENKNGKPGFLTDLEYGQLSGDIIEALENLMEGIKIGDATAYVDVSESTNRYRLRQGFKDLYHSVNGDLYNFMDFRLVDFDECIEDHFRPSSARQTASRTVAQRTRIIRREAEALAQYHYECTGEKVARIPYPTTRSLFYQESIEMDKGSVGKYWSSNVELAARAFEFYINEKLKEKEWVSDYLVCGVRGNVFPSDEREAKRIYRFMDTFMSVVRPMLTV